MKITLELTLEEFKKIRIVEDGELRRIVEDEELRPLIPTATDSEKPVKTHEPTESEGHVDPNEPAEQTKTVSREELRKYMMARCKAAGRNVAREVIQAMGYDNLADVPEEKLGELYEKMKEVA